MFKRPWFAKVFVKYLASFFFGHVKSSVSLKVLFFIKFYDSLK